MTFHPNLNLYHHFTYALRADISKLYITLAIRKFAMGLVGIFTPVYLFLYYGNSFSLASLYFGVLFGLYAVFAVFGGRFLARFGAEKSMFASSFFLVVHFLSLYALNASFLLVPLSLVSGALSLTLFWPSFHTEFARFSSKEHRGSESSRMNIAMIMPTIIAPALGGLVVGTLGFQVLFIIVSFLLIASVIPLFSATDRHEIYTDSFEGAWGRMFKKENRRISLSFLGEALDISLGLYVWPIFLFLVVPHFSEMGIITSIAFIASTLFMLYAGRISDTRGRAALLNVGAVWTSLAWVLRYFIVTPFGALLTNMNYEIARSVSSVPYRTYFYEKAAMRKEEADEFIIYFEVVSNMGRFIFFSLLAFVFWIFPQLPIQAAFFLGVPFALSFMLLGKPPRFTKSKGIQNNEEYPTTGQRDL